SFHLVAQVSKSHQPYPPCLLDPIQKRSLAYKPLPKVPIQELLGCVWPTQRVAQVRCLARCSRTPSKIIINKVFMSYSRIARRAVIAFLIPADSLMPLRGEPMQCSVATSR